MITDMFFKLSCMTNDNNPYLKDLKALDHIGKVAYQS